MSPASIHRRPPPHLASEVAGAVFPTSLQAALEAGSRMRLSAPLSLRPAIIH